MECDAGSAPARPDAISLKAAGPVTVVLIHGFTGSPAEMQLLAMAFQRSGYSVEVPLLQGHGTCWEELDVVNPQQWVDQLMALTQQLLDRGQRVVLAGQSLGSILALQLSLLEPRIEALLLYAPPIGSRDWRRFFAPVLPWFVRSVAKPQCRYADPATPQRLWSYDRYPARCTARVLAFIAAVRRHLPRVSTPFLVVASRRDKVVSARGVEALVQRCGSAETALVWLERSSHVITADGEWDAVRDASFRFLHANQLGGGSGDGPPCQTRT